MDRATTSGRLRLSLIDPKGTATPGYASIPQIWAHNLSNFVKLATGVFLVMLSPP